MLTDDLCGTKRLKMATKKPHSIECGFSRHRFGHTGIYGAGGDRTRVLAYCQLNVYTHRQTTYSFTE